jgi:WD40 repeat protein
VTAPERPIRRIDLPPSPFGTEAYSVALSPDGSLLYVGAVAPPSVTVYEVATGEPLRSAPGQGDGGPFQINPDGTLLAVPAGNEIVLLDAATLAERGRLRGHTALVRAVRLSHDGSRLASASDDRTAIVWNPATGDRQEQLDGHAGGVWNLAFSPDGDTLYTVSVDQAVLAWDLNGDRHLMHRMAVAEPVVSELPPPLAHVAHSAPTGDAVAYVTVAQSGAAEQTATVQLLNVSTGRAGEIVDTGHGDIGAQRGDATGAGSRPPARTASCACGTGTTRRW